MTMLFNNEVKSDSPLAGKSVKELLYLVADDEQGFCAEASELLLAIGIVTLFPELEQGVRDNNDANFRNGAMDTLVAFGKESVPYLVKLLKDSDEEVRNFVCVMLGDIGNRGAVSSLIRVLNDQDSNVSHSAAEALGKIGDRAALFPLVALLKGDFWVQFSAITAIGEMRDYRAVPHLLAILDNEMLTGAVADALGKIGDPRALHPLGMVLPLLNDVVAGHVARSMYDIYRSSAEMHNYKNSLTECHQPENIVKVLSLSGVKRLNSLLRSSSDRSVLEAVVMLLGWYGYLPALKDFFFLLIDNSMLESVEKAILSLGRAADNVLISALDNNNDNVKLVALRTLSYMGHCQFPDKIAAFLESPNSDLQLEAIETARHIPDSRYLPSLLDLVRSAPIATSFKAADAVASYPFELIREFIVLLASSESADSRARGAMLLCNFAEIGEPFLLDTLLLDIDAGVRKIAMKAAVKHKAEIAMPRLGAALNDPDCAVRGAAVMAIAEFSTPMLVEDLLGKLGSSGETLDYVIIRSLGIMEAKTAENSLVKYLGKESLSNRIVYVLLDTLGKIAASSASGIICNRYLSSSDQDIRRLAVETLGRLGDSSSLKAVESSLKDSHWSVRVAAVQVLGKLGGICEIPLLIRLMNDSDNMVRKSAIIALGDIRSHAAIPALVQQLDDMDMSKYVFSSLLKFGREILPWLHRHMMKNYNQEIVVRLVDLVGKIGDRKSVEPLMELLEDPSPAVRLAAIDSLAFCFDGILLKRLTAVKKYDEVDEVRERADLALSTFTMEKYN